MRVFFLYSDKYVHDIIRVKILKKLQARIL